MSTLIKVYNVANGLVTSGIRDFITTIDIASGSLTSGLMASGFIAALGGGGSGSPVASGFVLSGSVFGYFGPDRTIASGTVGSFDIASGSLNSGMMASGFIAALTSSPSITSGSVGSGSIQSGAVQGYFGTTPNIASGTVGVYDFGSGAVVAGSVGSGAIQSGQIASGQIGRFHVASGQFAGFELGSGAIVSGRIASGQIGNFHISSGAITSGRLGVTGTPDGTKVLRDDFTWVAPSTPTITSGSVGSGAIASGAVPGYFGPYRGIMSGTVGVFDLGSGAVVAGTVGSGAIASGNIASGVVGNFHLSSGSVSSGRIASGAVQGYISSGRNIASGTVGFYDIASGSLNSGMMASGFIDNLQMGGAAGLSGDLTGTTTAAVVLKASTLFSLPASITDSITADTSDWTPAGWSAGVTSLHAYSNGGPWRLNSLVPGLDGQLLIIRPPLGGGAITLVNGGTFTTGSGAPFSLPTNITLSTITDCVLLRFDGSASITWELVAGAGAGVGPTSIGSGAIGSGAVQGYFGTTWNIASGTVGLYDIASGSLNSGMMASGFIANLGNSAREYHRACMTANSTGIIPGVAVYVNGVGTVKTAIADLPANANTVGLSVDTIANTTSGYIAVEGVLSLTTAQWDTAWGTTGGLGSGAKGGVTYYLTPYSNSGGAGTEIAPTASGQFVVELGQNLNATDFMIRIQPMIQL